jgi:hypothetical protein
MTLLETLATCLDRKHAHREALAEAVLLDALQNPKRLAAFGKIAGLHGGAHLIKADRQLRSDSGAARHDLVVVSKSQRKYFIELKGFGGYTARQQRALKLGDAAGAERIDVLIIPDGEPEPDHHQHVTVCRWSDLDYGVIDVKRYGRVVDLWRGPGQTAWPDLEAAARSYIRFYKKDVDTATWAPLWRSLIYLQTAVVESKSRVAFGSTNGSRNGNGFAYYGKRIFTEKIGKTGKRVPLFWFGWVFSVSPPKPFRLALVVFEKQGRCPPKVRSPMPGWTEWPEKGAVLAEFSPPMCEQPLNLTSAADCLQRIVHHAY